ncbi:MAG TPA: hypothetical protein VHR86_06460, partial [Armatimonadota bacterium]|nr:hypothetical protein [Armatimonadota bacterium]
MIDGKRAAFPAQYETTPLYSAPARSLVLNTTDGTSLRFDFAQPTPLLIQDDRQWGPDFMVRIGPQMPNSQVWSGGKPLVLDFTLVAQGGIAVEYDGPITIAAGADWLPLDLQLEVEAGSALDFSQLVPWYTPAGKLGRVIATPDGKMAFTSRPNEPVRFYGFNMVGTSQYITHEQADQLATRLQRLGYNAVRLHHHEGTLVDRSGGSSTTCKPLELDQLDYFFAALKKRGIYVTTDLYVSRPIYANEVWPGEKDDVGMDEFKMAVSVNERAFANYKAFAVNLLGHVNPYTGMRWVDDPALAWLSLINEGNPGNFTGRMTDRLKKDYTVAWNRWLAERYPTRDALVHALGNLPADQDPKAGTVALPDGMDDTPTGIQYSLFLTDNQRTFFERTRAFLRDEMHCQALLTNLNAWTNPLQLQSLRAQMDYVDDHFYVDHPQFLEQSWQLPSRCPNTSPVAAGAPGGRNCPFLRLMDRPFTISEYNYSGPGRFRGVGGILTGALGAVQDGSIIWRFAYSHSRDNLFTPSIAGSGYFDMATDPLSQAADRASLCLFRRGDMRPATHSVAIAMTPAELMQQPKSA